MSGKTVITEAELSGSSSFTEAVKPGSYVEEKIVDNFLGYVPTAIHRSNFVQYGEPYSSSWDEKEKRYKATHLTFFYDGAEWQYLGTCFLGESTHRA